MKRKNNLYSNICSFDNIVNCYNEVRTNIQNKNKTWYLNSYKSVCIADIQNTLINRNYVVGPYHHFTIYEPKLRKIVNQNVKDKIINHLVARYILQPALTPSLIDSNVASRKNKGTAKGLLLAQKYYNKCSIKYKTFYILKCDIAKFFSNIDHNILKEKILKKIKDKDALKIVFDIIDSNTEGLFIGSMTSQILAIFYLNDLDHYIKETLKIKYYVRYQDDFLLFHESKDYLKYCLEKISEFLEKERLTLNSKTRLYKNTNNFTFLGRTTKDKYSRYRCIYKKLSNRYKEYKNGNLTLNSLCSSMINFKKISKNDNIKFKRKQ